MDFFFFFFFAVTGVSWMPSRTFHVVRGKKRGLDPSP